MGLFDRLFGKEKAQQAASAAPEIPAAKPQKNLPHILRKETSHTVSDSFAGQRFTFSVNDIFRTIRSNAAEVEMLSVYAPEEADIGKPDLPYIAIQQDDPPFCAVESFKENGTVPDAIECKPLSGRMLFRAKIEYYDSLMYFYGFESEDAVWDMAGLCLVYPKEYAGTPDETLLMQMLDEAAASFVSEDDDEAD